MLIDEGLKVPLFLLLGKVRRPSPAVMGGFLETGLLGDSLNVLPGHGAVTTIGRERKQSPYLRPDYLESMKRGGDRG